MLRNNKQIVLALMSGSETSLWPVSRLIQAAELFDIPSASLRVVLGRLVKDGTITQVSRGVYAISEKGKHMQEALARWSHFDELVKPWQGGWIACYTAHLGRVDRKLVVRRERALALNGFACLQQGLWVRPDNLSQLVSSLRSKLVNLGLEEDAYLMQVSSFSEDHIDQLLDLWDVRGLETNYQSLIGELDKALEEIEGLSLGESAKQSLEMGHLVVASLAYDPLLPESMIDIKLRQEVCSKMRTYDEVGQRKWREFYEEAEAFLD